MRISIFGDADYAADYVPVAKKFHRTVKRRSKLRPHFYYERFVPKEGIEILSRPWMDDIVIFSTPRPQGQLVDPEYTEDKTWKVIERLNGIDVYAANSCGLGLISMFHAVCSFDYHLKKRIELYDIFQDGPVYGGSIQGTVGSSFLVKPTEDLDCFDVVMTEANLNTGVGAHYASASWKKVYDTSFPSVHSNHGNSIVTIGPDGTIRYSEHPGDYVYGEIGPKKTESVIIGYDSSLDIYTGSSYMLGDMSTVNNNTFALSTQDVNIFIATGKPNSLYSENPIKKRPVLRISDRVILTGKFSYTVGPLRYAENANLTGLMGEFVYLFIADITIDGFFELFAVNNSGEIIRRKILVSSVFIPYKETDHGSYVSSGAPYNSGYDIEHLFSMVNTIDPTMHPGDYAEFRNYFMNVASVRTYASAAFFGSLSVLMSDSVSGIGGFSFCGHSIMSIAGEAIQFDGDQFVGLPHSKDEAAEIVRSIANRKDDYTFHNLASIGYDMQLVEKYSKDLKRFVVANPVQRVNGEGVFSKMSYSLYDATTLSVIFETEEIGRTEETQHWICDAGYGGAIKGALTTYPRIFCSDNMDIIAVYYHEFAGAVFRIDDGGHSTKLFDVDEESVEPIFIHDKGLVVATKEKIWMHKSLCGHTGVGDGFLISCTDCAGIFYDYSHFVDHTEENVFQIKKIDFTDMSISVVDSISGCNYFELAEDSSVGLFARAFESELDEGYMDRAPVYIVDFIDKPFVFESTDIDRTFVFPEYLFGVSGQYAENTKIGYKRRFPYGRRMIGQCSCTMSECEACSDRKLENLANEPDDYMTCDATAVLQKGLAAGSTPMTRHSLALPYNKIIRLASFGTSMYDFILGGATNCPFFNSLHLTQTSPEIRCMPKAVCGQFSDGFSRREKYSSLYEDKRLNKFMVIASFADNRKSTDVGLRYNEDVFVVRRRLDNLDNIEGQKIPKKAI